MVGRAADLERALGLLRTGVRLLTLTGPGGVGKTRLADAVAAGVAAEGGPVAVRVDLGPLRDPALVLPTTARALGLAEGGSRPIAETLQRALAPSPALLVLDNLEHLLAAAPGVAELLRGCPVLQVVVASRAPLQVPGEHQLEVAPLPVPNLRELSLLAGLERYPSVELFVRRCRQVHADFALTPANAHAVAEICVRLDGLPLALELAAVQAKVLEPQQLLARLRDRFVLLAQPGRAAPPRHRTLASTVAWSYDLLEPQGQLLFRRLTVFASSWTLEAAEGVCPGDGLAEAEILPLLQVLVDHSLVQVQHQGERCRYRLLETLREFGAHALLERGEEPAVRRRHRSWFLQVAGSAQQSFPGPAEAAWLDQLEQDHDDLRSALADVPPEDLEAALRAAAGLSFFWDVRGYLGEGTACLRRLLSTHRAAASFRARAGALEALGRLALARDDHRAATAALREAQRLFEGLGDPGRAAWALASLSISAFRQDDQPEASALAAEAVALALRSQDVAASGRAGAAEALAAGGLGRTREAGRLLEASLALGREWGSDWSVAKMAHFAGWFALLDGDVEGGRALQRESVSRLRGLRDRRMLADCLDVLACLAVAVDDLAAAQVDFALAARLREEVGCPRPVYLRGRCAAALAALAAAPRPAAAARAGGDVGTILDHVLTPESPAGAVASELLTAREREVAVLVARGAKNADIGVALSISARTAERHLENVRRKLDVHSRAQVAAWVATYVGDG